MLQQRTQEMEQSLEPLYEGYLKALSEASGRQLVMAAYHICTQAYPDKFLGLSLRQRNQLQQDIQALSGSLYNQLMAQREQAKKSSRRAPKNNGLAFLQRLLDVKSSGAAIIATDGSADSLLEKLSALRLSDDEGVDDESADESALEERQPGHDWLDDVPSAEADEETEQSDENVDIFESGFEREASQSDQEFSADTRSSGDLLDHAADDAPLDSEADSEADVDSDRAFEMEVPPADERLTLTDEDDLLSALEGLARRSAEAEEIEAEDEPLAPVHLVRQQMLLEKGIRKVFEQISEQTNELLQKADIVPRFPKALLASAAGPREIGEPINSVPNVFKVSVRVMHGEALMETDEDERAASERPRRKKQSRESDRRRKPRRPRRMPREMPREMPPEMIEIDALPELSMISMQLSEVEFSDHTVSAWRSRIRQEFESLKKLGRRYQKTQRALETAQAEDAWRASWSVREDSGNSSLE